jgi:hypothetical protein
MNYDLSFYLDVDHQNLYLEVDYQVENSQVTVKSVHLDGHDISRDLSKGNQLAIAQQIIHTPNGRH